MARGRPRKGMGTGSGGSEKPPKGVANPAAAFERLVKRRTRPDQRDTTIGYQPGQRVDENGLPERLGDCHTPEQKFLFRRRAFIRNVSKRVPKLDKEFQLLLNLSSRETYKYSAKEGERLVARCRAWTDAVEESFKRRNPFRPMDLPPITLESTEALIRETMFPAGDDTPPAGLEGYWG